MKVKIISDGMARNSKVINMETGEIIEGVNEATWNLKANGLATVTLKILGVPVEIEGSWETTKSEQKEWTGKAEGHVA
jgi:hypothetical protein